jgi:hypothetical protein
VYRLPHVQTSDVRALGYSEDPEDPLFDAYPIDGSELRSWASERSGATLDTENCAYFIEQATEESYARMLDRGWEHALGESPLSDIERGTEA